jgi:hypothetical protein
MNFSSISPSDFPEGLLATNLSQSAIVEKWFSAEEGLRAINGLMAAAESSVLDARIVQNLDSFRRVLTVASQHGVRWRLAIDY